MLERARAFSRDPRVQVVAMTLFVLSATYAFDQFLDPYRPDPNFGYPGAFDSPPPDYYVDATGPKGPHPFSFNGSVESATFSGFRFRFNASGLQTSSLTVLNATGTLDTPAGESTFTAGRLRLDPGPGETLVALRGALELITQDNLSLSEGKLTLTAVADGGGTALRHGGLLVLNVAITHFDHEGRPYDPVQGLVRFNAGTVVLGGNLTVTPSDAALPFSKAQDPVLSPEDAFRARVKLEVEAPDQKAHVRVKAYPVVGETVFELADGEGVLDTAPASLSVTGRVYQWMEGDRPRFPGLLAAAVLEGFDAHLGDDGNMTIAPREGGSDVVVRLREAGGAGSAVGPRLEATDNATRFTVQGWYASWQAAKERVDPIAPPQTLAPGESAFLRVRIVATPGPLNLAANATNAPMAPVQALVGP